MVAGSISPNVREGSGIHWQNRREITKEKVSCDRDMGVGWCGKRMTDKRQGEGGKFERLNRTEMRRVVGSLIHVVQGGERRKRELG